MQRNILWLAIAGLLVCGFVAGAMSLDEALDRFQNDEIMVETQQELETLIDALVTAHEADPESELLLVRLAQAHFVLADVFLADAGAKKDAYAAGQQYGEAALRLDPVFVSTEADQGFAAAVATATHVAAVHWTAANWTAKDEYDILGALFRGDPPKLLALFERELALDPYYAHGAPYRSFGAFWSGLPKLGVGSFTQDLDKSRDALCHVVSDPDACASCGDCPTVDDALAYFENRIFYVRFVLIKTEEWAKAEAILESVLAEEIGDLYPLYNRVNQERARTYLEDVRKHLP